VRNNSAGGVLALQCIRRAASWEATNAAPITDIDIVYDSLLPGAPLPLPRPGFDVIADDVNEGGGKRGSPYVSPHFLCYFPHI
jgi:hypothetical protein